MIILVTGGAGYIGSMMTKQLLEEGHQVVVFDNLSNGHQDTIDNRAQFIQGDVTHPKDLQQAFDAAQVDAVIHFGGVISAGESMKDPAKYFRINTLGSLNLLEEMIRHDIKTFIFSSTAAVYGNPDTVPIPEHHATRPTNTYGESKLMTEHMLQWFATCHNLNYAALRYFNASGASLDGTIGELHKDESHIIPRAMKVAMNGGTFTLFGTDYDTKDGTCVRDYIHIEDLCQAHLCALDLILQEKKSVIFNVGTGNGYSNREIIDMIKTVSGTDIQIEENSRRAGDPAELVADSSKLQKDTGWKPEHSDLRTIIESAWKFHAKNGFGE